MKLLLLEIAQAQFSNAKVSVSIYGTPEAAADIPRTIFPENIVNIMDLDTIRIENTIYVDKGREVLCDLILIIPLKGEFDGLRIVLLLKILQSKIFQ